MNDRIIIIDEGKNKGKFRGFVEDPSGDFWYRGYRGRFSPLFDREQEAEKWIASKGK